jgi:hypothetical protein
MPFTLALGVLEAERDREKLDKQPGKQGYTALGRSTTM